MKFWGDFGLCGVNTHSVTHLGVVRQLDSALREGGFVQRYVTNSTKFHVVKDGLTFSWFSLDQKSIDFLLFDSCEPDFIVSNTSFVKI